MINIRATIAGTNITSCEYTTGGVVREIANAITGYCEATNLIFTDTIDVQFRATNSG